MDALLKDIEYARGELNEAWKSALCISCENEIGEMGVYVIDEDGYPTAIPSYTSYRGNWNRSYYKNPLEVSFDKYFKSLDGGFANIKYIETVVGTITEQLGIYSLSPAARETKVFKALKKFNDLLREVYLNYSIN